MDFSQVLNAARLGDTQARADLIQAAYDDLRRIAARKMADERQDHTLTATALVHEASLKLLDDNGVPVESRGQFFAYAAKAMRNLLIDHARVRGRQKRGGDRQKFTIDEAMVACEEQRDDLLRLNEALEELAALEPRKAQVVEMRYFGGMSNQEIASALDVSLATVKREWSVAKAWLMHEVVQGEDDPENAG